MIRKLKVSCTPDSYILQMPSHIVKWGTAALQNLVDLGLVAQLAALRLLDWFLSRVMRYQLGCKLLLGLNVLACIAQSVHS